jgi:hypothetical protein
MDNSIPNTPNGLESASTSITDPSHFCFINFVMPTSRAMTPSVQRDILSTRIAQAGISKDFDAG